MYVCGLTASAAILSFSLPSIAVSWWVLLKGRPLSSRNQKYIFDLTVTSISQTGRNDYHQIIFVDIYLLFCLISKKTQKKWVRYLLFASPNICSTNYYLQKTICNHNISFEAQKGVWQEPFLDVCLCLFTGVTKFRLHRNFSGEIPQGRDLNMDERPVLSLILSLYFLPL